MFARIKQLRKKGILGINQRNCELLMAGNQRHYYPAVDDKLITKQKAIEAGIAVPPLYHVVYYNGDINGVCEQLKRYDDFVVKPAQGAAGNGILVITGRENNRFRKISGELIGSDEFKFHISDIISGVYSLGGHPDKAMVEYRVKFTPVFKRIAYLGTPDIRILVYLGVPILAMLRLPTKASDGKANLHQGAMGVGIHMSSGLTGSAVCNNKLIDEHPDTGFVVKDLQIPNWPQLLKLAIDCYPLSRLDYFGADFVLDDEYGPMLLEINARPGLSIQIANQVGIEPRIDKVKRHIHELTSSDKKFDFACAF